MRAILSVLMLFVLWLLMSGVYKPMIVAFGLASAIIAVYVARRMDDVDKKQVSLPLHPVKSMAYLIWLMGEIVKSNIAVTKLILAPNVALRQHLFQVPNTQESELAEVVFANSITLTPGTITVETETDRFWVHAVNYSNDDMDGLADMDRRVTAVEVRPK